MVLADASALGRRAGQIIASLHAGRQANSFPVFLIVEGSRYPNVPAVDGCLARDTGLRPALRAILEVLPAWRVLKAERRRLTEGAKALRKETRRLRKLVVRDDLTSLYNLRFFERTLATEHARATRFGRQYSLIFIDLDQLRDINNRYGHLAGSHALKRLGEYLGEKTRHIDVAARLGGDEFVVISPETSKAAARIVAERIRQDIETIHVHEQGGVIKLTASLGVASFPEDGDLPEQILERADRALYVAKARGRNTVCGWGDTDARDSSDTARGSLHGVRIKSDELLYTLVERRGGPGRSA
jgi:diguanylate cyclase (GGDEF)-like protein